MSRLRLGLVWLVVAVAVAMAGSAVVDGLVGQRGEPSPGMTTAEDGDCTTFATRLDEQARFDDVVYDPNPEGETVTFYGLGESYRLTPADANCIRDHPAVERQVRHAVETYVEGKTSECESLRRQLAGPDDARPRRHGAPLDREALGRYAEEVCADWTSALVQSLP